MPVIYTHPQLRAIGGWNVGYRPTYAEVTWYTTPICEVNISVNGDLGESGGETGFTSESPVIIPLTWAGNDYLLSIVFGLANNDSYIYITNLKFQ